MEVSGHVDSPFAATRKTLVPIEQVAGWAQAMAWTDLGKITPLAPAGIRTLDSTAHN